MSCLFVLQTTAMFPTTKTEKQLPVWGHWNSSMEWLQSKENARQLLEHCKNENCPERLIKTRHFTHNFSLLSSLFYFFFLTLFPSWYTDGIFHIVFLSLCFIKGCDLIIFPSAWAERPSEIDTMHHLTLGSFSVLMWQCSRSAEEDEETYQNVHTVVLFSFLVSRAWEDFYAKSNKLLCDLIRCQILANWEALSSLWKALWFECKKAVLPTPTGFTHVRILYIVSLSFDTFSFFETLVVCLLLFFILHVYSLLWFLLFDSPLLFHHIQILSSVRIFDEKQSFLHHKLLLTACI